MAILFEKTYPNPDFEKMIEDADNAKKDPRAIAFLEQLEEMRQKAIYEPIPERIEESKKLVQMVQAFSEKYEIDAKAEQDDNRIIILLQFFYDYLSTEMTRDFAAILALVDDMIFMLLDEQDETGVMMTYRTHKAIPPKEKEQQSR